MNFKFIIFSTFFCFLLNIDAQEKDSLPIEVPTKILLKKVNQHSFSISPDGKYFVEVIENNIENDIVVVDIDNYKLYQRIPIGKNTIQNIYWLSSDRLIYESLGEIYAIDIDGKNSKILVNRFADNVSNNFYDFYKNLRLNAVVNLLHNDKNEILIETYDFNGFSSIKRVNVFTGQKITVIDGSYYKMNKWILDTDGNVRMGVKFDDDSYNYFTKNEQNQKWEPFQLKMNGEDIPLKVDANSYLNQVVSFEGFGYTNDIIYITSNLFSDKRSLMSYNILEKRVVEVLMEDINCDVNDPDGEGVSFIFDFKKRDLAGIRFEAITPMFKWYSREFEIIHNEINSLYPSVVNDIIDTDSKSERLLIHQWSDVSTGNIGVYNSIDKTYSIMFSFNQELDTYNLSRTKVIITTSRDDYKVPCYFNLPIDNANSGSVPLIVIPHGGPWARDYWGLDTYTQYFATRGYAVLRVNYRGSTGFGKKHVLAGINSIDEIMINDIADAVKFVSGKYGIDDKRIFVFGHSYGGYAAYMSLLKYPDLYASGVALSAPTDIKEWMKTQKKDKNYFSYEFWKTALGTNDSKYLSKISPINYASELNKPLLIFHGKNDKIVNVEQAENMVNAIRQNYKYVKLEVLQREGHTIEDSNSVGYILDSSNEFFKKSVIKN